VPTLLSINNYFYRRDGSEAIYIDHNRMFAGSGWDVIPFSMQHPENPPSPWSQHFVTDIEFGSDYSLHEKLARIPKVIYSLEARRKIGRLLEDVHPHIAHCHSIYHHLSPSILDVLRGAHIPTVMTLHDLKIACPAYHMFDGHSVCEKCKGGKLHNVVTHRCIKGSLALSTIVMTEAIVQRLLGSYAKGVERFISPCQFYIDKLVEWGWPRERFVHVPNFVDEEALQPHFEPGRALLYFGRLSAEKGLATLVRAAAIAQVPVRIVGDGPLMGALREAATRLGADVSFTGRLDGDALFEEVRQARATVLPAEWYENAPMSILESYALGKPVIGADIGGIPELIEHGVTGWIFPSGSAQDLATVLRAVADMPDARVAAAGRRARALLEAEFSRARYQRRMVDLYASLGAVA
jgi:glycosyltransferase involved in cell wall biosynthesis